MFFKNLVVLFLGTNVASALEGLRVILPITANIDMKRIVDAGFMRKSYWDECRLLRGERENNTPALLETLYIGIGAGTLSSSGFMTRLCTVINLPSIQK